MSDNAKKLTFERLSLEPENQPFSGVMANGKKYIIPRFQRDYSWETDHWEELWKDIEEMRERKIQHFMEYLVFQSMEGKTLAVIDGQQRLITLSIVVLAAISKLQALIANKIQPDDNQTRIDSYIGTYIGIFDAVTLTTNPKLVLNRHNEQHFRYICKTFEVTTQRNITATNRRINKAFNFFKGKLQSYQSGEEVAQMIAAIEDGLLFTTITVQDDLNAYTVFETLNARGVHLSTPDLLKNYLLSIMAGNEAYVEEHFHDFETQWAVVLEQLGETEFTNFLRSYRGIQKKLANKKDLFRMLKSDVQSPENVLPYLGDLRKYAPIYAALQNRHDSFWAEHDGQYSEVHSQLEALGTFSIKTPLSLLMASFQKLSPKDFIDFLKRIVAISIRYNVICSQPAKTQEQIYNAVANKMANEDATLRDITDKLRPVYPDDDSFSMAFSSKTQPSRRSSKKILFLLRKIEQQISGNEPPLSLTLEHILPFKPDDGWQEYFGRETVEQAIDRLGNMALLPSNQNMDQESFEEKRKVLQESSYKINQHIAEYSEWNMSTMEDHQKWLAKQARVVWKISQLEQQP